MKVTIQAKNRRFEFQADGEANLLTTGLSQAIALPYACGSGTCGTCKATLVSGSLKDGWPDAPGKKTLKPEKKQFLMCQCAPVTDCEIEVASFVYGADPGTCLPDETTGVISHHEMLTHDVAMWEIILDRPIEFHAGQFVLIGLPGIQGYRAYSMLNFDRKQHKLKFIIKKKPGGAFSERLFESSPEGLPVRVIGPLGNAVFNPSLGKNILCIAGGSGIAGMMSILARAVEERYFEQHKGYVFFGVRTTKDLFFLQELSNYCLAFEKTLEVVIALSDEEVTPAVRERYPYLHFETGFVHDVASRLMQDKYKNIHAYLAGPPPAVDAAMRMLIINAKLSPNNILFDKFN